MTTTAVVIAGSGARGAYEAGVLSVLIPRLVAEDGGRGRILLVGTSAGAINAALLAGVTDPDSAVERAVELWRSVGASDVFARLRRTVVRDALAYVGEVAGRGRGFRSLLDSTPLRDTMTARMDWDRLRSNLDRGTGWAGGVGVVTTACGTGRTAVFLQGKGLRPPPRDDIRGIDYLQAHLDVPHVLASAAIPVAFLPVPIERPGVPGWHIDGGVRLNAPIKPALALGADRVMVVATTPDPDVRQRRQPPLPEPDVFDAAGVVLQATLLDRMAEDVRSLRRTNALVAPRGPAIVARNGRPYRVVDHVYLGPPNAMVIRETAERVFRKRYGGVFSRWSDTGTIGRLIGGSPQSRGELLSFLFFDPHFHDELIELGRRHAGAALGPGPGIPWRT